MSEDDVTALETATSDFPIASGILSHLLYPRAAARSAGAIVKWWEKRRLSYNLIVGGGAGLSVVIGGLLWLLPPNDLPLEIIPLEG